MAEQVVTQREKLESAFLQLQDELTAENLFKSIEEMKALRAKCAEMAEQVRDLQKFFYPGGLFCTVQPYDQEDPVPIAIPVESAEFINEAFRGAFTFKKSPTEGSVYVTELRYPVDMFNSDFVAYLMDYPRRKFMLDFLGLGSVLKFYGDLLEKSFYLDRDNVDYKTIGIDYNDYTPQGNALGILRGNNFKVIRHDHPPIEKNGGYYAGYTSWNVLAKKPE